MSCRIRAVEHRKCAARLSDAHPGLQDRNSLNCTIIENVHEVRKKTFNFLSCIEDQQIFSFPFSLLRHHQLFESFYAAVFEQQFYHATEAGNVANAVSACADQP